MAWEAQGNLKGPKGDKGDQGDQGPRGEDGAGVSIAGQVADYASLPEDLGPEDAGKGYLVTADGKLYVWSGTAFPADGAGAEFRGPEGPQGPKGDDGDQGPQGPAGDQGTTGNTGADGPKGDKGDTGDAGQRGSRWFNGTGAPGVVSGSAVGDYYLDTVDGTIYLLS